MHYKDKQWPGAGHTRRYAASRGLLISTYGLFPSHTPRPTSVPLSLAMTLDLDKPRAAIAASAAERERLRALSPSDPERIAALEAVLGNLRDCWTQEHEAHCRRGPQRDKATYKKHDPVRVVGRERRAEMRKVRDMLRTDSGAARVPAGTAKRPTQRERAPVYDRASMIASLNSAAARLNAIGRDHEEAINRHRHGSITATKGGGFFMSMRELHEEAHELLGRLDGTRRALTRALGRYERGWRQEHDPYDDEWNGIHERAALLRADAAKLSTELRRSLATKKPDPIEEDPTWTRGRILRALDAYYREHGDLPTATRCNARPDLPSYTIMTRKLGPRPLSEARGLLRLPGAAGSVAQAS